MLKRVVNPIKNIKGKLVLRGSKSITNRALLLAALAQGSTEISNILVSEDTQVMLKALASMGVPIEQSGSTAKIDGKASLKAVEQGLYLANAGTAMRSLTAVLANQHGTHRLTGTKRMSERPIADLVDALRQLGASINYLDQDGCPPLSIIGQPLQAQPLTVSGQQSSQYISALLLATPLMRGTLELEVLDLVSAPYVTMTTEMMRTFGINTTNHSNHYTVEAGQNYSSPGHYHVEGDASSASYFIAMAALSQGSLRIEGCGEQSLQGDVQFARVLAKLGANIKLEAQALEIRGGERLSGGEINAQDFPDAAMTLAVLGLFCTEPLLIKGIANWRIKECDRLLAMSTELRKLGAQVATSADSICVRPLANIKPATIETYQDHRIAMAFVVAACGNAPITILNPECVNKTYPDFFEQLERLVH